MFDHPIIDVGLSLMFLYVVLSLLASAIQEWIASLFALRARNLRKGLKNLISDAYATKVYEHPLVKNLSKADKLPSYIAPETLSGVLLEIVAKENSSKSYVSHTAQEVKTLIETLSHEHPLKEILATLVDDDEHATSALRERLANWIDEGMSRIAGWYKRQAKVLIFLIAGVVTLATNTSTVHVAEEFWRNDALRTQVATQAQMAAHVGDHSRLDESTLESLKVFPIGWVEPPKGVSGWFKTLLGWLLTTAAVSLGAPFWFDLLNKVANLRGSGEQAQLQKPS